jgi:hypothetical protein
MLTVNQSEDRCKRPVSKGEGKNKIEGVRAREQVDVKLTVAMVVVIVKRRGRRMSE